MKTKKASSSVRKQSATTTQQLKTARPWYILLMPCIIAIYGFAYFERGEILALNYGGGWDGTSYVYLAVASKEEMKTDSYRSQRILPTLIVRYGADVAQRFASDPNVLFGDLFYRWFYGSKAEFRQRPNPSLAVEAIVVYFFMWYSLAIMILCGLLWAGICYSTRLSPMAQWLGFIGLVGNFAFLKMSLFYPTLTDLTALCIGLLSLFGYIARQSWLVLLSGFIGAFTWPTTFIFSAILFLFPPPTVLAKSPEHSPDNVFEKSFLSQSRIAAFVISIILGALAAWFVYFQDIRFPGVEEVHRFWAALGIVLLVIYGTFALEPLIHLFIQQRFLTKTLGIFRQPSQFLPLLARICLLLIVWCFAWYIRQGFINPNAPSPLNFSLFLAGSFTMATTKPLLNIVAHTVYFGPIILLFLLLYRRIIHSLESLGFGFTAAMTVIMLLSTIMTESRQLINIFPFIVLATVYYLSSTKISPSLIVVTGVLGIFSSKIWLPLNFKGLQEFVMKGGMYSEFPMQLYFMNHGPWMIWTSYVWQAGAVLVAGVFLFFLTRLTARQES